MRARSLLTVLVTALLAMLTLASPSQAVDGVYPPAGVRVVAGELSSAEVADGQAVTFSGGGFAPGALLRMSVDGVQTGTTTADSEGGFSVDVPLTGVGERVLAASGLETSGRVRVVSATVTVVAAGAEAQGGALPTSGADALPALLGGLGLVVGGAAVVFVARQRPRSRSPRSA
ncbi:MAG: hypothetical protein Q8R60_11355 [Mycobacteriales bacterium]|nr:hypothetical protein [Mycobacteriales bacterium]